ncbi:MAG: hypothetical protein CYPHOPRED_003064 [Cyphobasidiales sp. Tagirdzhanova-0007]|nr:MAG: hypothetical protein CYPHOPRED_003064 [Cyphobasidiales sp. Tagirdzhanova-0007]
MDYLLPTFKTVSVIFAISAIATGANAIMDPVGFSKFFGLPLSPTNNDEDTSRTVKMSHSYQCQRNLTMSYISLMGVRQLATGIILLTFAYQNKWTEMATILAIIGIIVAGTDGIYLSRAGVRGFQFHAIPGTLIALLAVGVIRSTA